MNDYDKSAQDLQDCIDQVETAYDNAQDEEDQADLQNILDQLATIRDRLKNKAAS